MVVLVAIFELGSRLSLSCQAEEVVVYHTDPNHARPPLVEALEANGHIVHTPVNGVSDYLGEEYSRSN